MGDLPRGMQMAFDLNDRRLSRLITMFKSNTLSVSDLLQNRCCASLGDDKDNGVGLSIPPILLLAASISSLGRTRPCAATALQFSTR